jgi:hypothetical protein
MRTSIGKIALVALMAGQMAPISAQTVLNPIARPAPQPQPEIRPKPLPQPVRPRPLPSPAPGWSNPDPGFGRPGESWQYGGYQGETSCESRNGQLRRCRLNTEGRVTLLNSNNGRCRMNRDWGFDRFAIWVDNNCRGRFAYGYGNVNPGGDYDYHDDDKGPSAGLIVGGVAVAAGLIALLASKKKKNNDNNAAGTGGATQAEPAPTPAPAPSGPATLEADLSAVPANAKPSMQICLDTALQQVSATGGSKLRFNRITKLEPGNGGWRINAQVTATYADGDSELPIFCRATPTKVVELDFIA